MPRFAPYPERRTPMTGNEPYVLEIDMAPVALVAADILHRYVCALEPEIPFTPFDELDGVEQDGYIEVVQAILTEACKLIIPAVTKEVAAQLGARANVFVGEIPPNPTLN